MASNDGLPCMDLAYLPGNCWQPINELMRAMILRTVEDLQTATGEVYDEALEYIHSTDDEYIFSFISICQHLGFDPDKTRNEILTTNRHISTRRRAA